MSQSPFTGPAVRPTMRNITYQFPSPVTADPTLTMLLDGTIAAIIVRRDRITAHNVSLAALLAPASPPPIWVAYNCSYGQPAVILTTGGVALPSTAASGLDIYDPTTGTLTSAKYPSPAGFAVLVSDVGLAFALRPRPGVFSAVSMTPFASSAFTSTVSDANVGNLTAPAAIGTDRLYSVNAAAAGATAGLTSAIALKGGSQADFLGPAASFAVGPVFDAANSTVLVGCQDGNVYAFDAEASTPGTVRWSVTLDGPVTGGLALTESGLLIVATDASVHAVAPESGTGSIVWSLPLDSPMTTRPVIDAADVAFFGTRSGTLYAVDCTTGAVQWQSIIPSRQPILGLAITPSSALIVTVSDSDEVVVVMEDSEDAAQ